MVYQEKQNGVCSVSDCVNTHIYRRGLPKYKEAFIADMSLIQFTDKNTGDKLYALNIDEIAPVEYARMQ